MGIADLLRGRDDDGPAGGRLAALPEGRAADGPRHLCHARRLSSPDGRRRYRVAPADERAHEAALRALAAAGFLGFLGVLAGLGAALRLDGLAARAWRLRAGRLAAPWRMAGRTAPPLTL